MPEKDKLAVTDSLEATIATPEDTDPPMGMVAEPQRRGATLPHTVEKKDPRGYAAYVSWQDAPLCVRNLTFADTEQAIEDNLAAYLSSVTQAQADEAFGRSA